MPPPGVATRPSKEERRLCKQGRLWKASASRKLLRSASPHVQTSATPFGASRRRTIDRREERPEFIQAQMLISVNVCCLEAVPENLHSFHVRVFVDHVEDLAHRKHAVHF